MQAAGEVVANRHVSARRVKRRIVGRGSSRIVGRGVRLRTIRHVGSWCHVKAGVVGGACQGAACPVMSRGCALARDDGESSGIVG